MQVTHVSDDAPYPGSDEGVSIPNLYRGHLDGILISNAELNSRIHCLSEQIQNDYADKYPLLLCVLKGSAVFFHKISAHLASLNVAHSYEYISVSSYDGTKSTENVTISKMNIESLKDREVIVIEDIVDTGHTLMRLLPYLETNGSPKSLVVCSMLKKRLDDKSQQKEVDEKLGASLKYCGFSIPNKFVIGSGLDYNEMYRDLKDVWIISKKGIENEGHF